MRLIDRVLVTTGNSDPVGLLCAVFAHNSDLDVPANVVLSVRRSASTGVAPVLDGVQFDIINDPLLTLAESEIGDGVRGWRSSSTPVRSCS